LSVFSLSLHQPTLTMNILKATTHSTRFVSKGGISSLKRSQVVATKSRFYSTAPQALKTESSSIPWAIGSLIVFGPLLFKLTSPPPSKKNKSASEQVEHVAASKPKVIAVVEGEEKDQESAQEEESSATAAEPVKQLVQKPYVLIGAGTASFAAAQAIKEKDPQANVSRYSEVNRGIGYL
jgi:programmed cell death 8 (apoptosis-inducing factor)